MNDTEYENMVCDLFDTLLEKYENESMAWKEACEQASAIKKAVEEKAENEMRRKELFKYYEERLAWQWKSPENRRFTLTHKDWMQIPL